MGRDLTSVVDDAVVQDPLCVVEVLAGSHVLLRGHSLHGRGRGTGYCGSAALGMQVYTSLILSRYMGKKMYSR